MDMKLASELGAALPAPWVEKSKGVVYFKPDSRAVILLEENVADFPRLFENDDIIASCDMVAVDLLDIVGGHLCVQTELRLFKMLGDRLLQWQQLKGNLNTEFSDLVAQLQASLAPAPAGEPNKGSA